ncbi:MAG: hybrid sensor histidine kinase/response regulator, partial [Chryseobacterium sp.]
NEVWFATRNGISTLNLVTQKFANYKHDPLDPKSLNDNTIWSFLKDRSNCIWVGTFAGGINFYYNGNSNFQNIGENVGKPLGLNHILVTAVAEDRDESFWVGTFGGGLNHISRKENFSKYYTIRAKNNTRPSNGVRSLADDGKGNLWVGTLDGLSLFNKATENLTYFDFKARDGRLSENLILCILPDRDGAWVGTNGGGLRYTLKDGSSPVLLFKKPKKGNQSLRYNLLADYKTIDYGNGYTLFDSAGRVNQAEIADNFVTALLKDGPEHLWIGTQNGLNYYDIKADRIERLYQKVRDTKFQISNSNVSALFRDSKNRLWIGTEEGGLNYFDQKSGRFYAIDKKEGLMDNVIHSIVEDDLKNIWVSTDLGLYKINFKKFRLPFEQEDLNITSYTANDGLISNQFSTQAGLKLKSNEILFGGINGITIFYPEKILKNLTPPNVVITELLVNNNPLAIADGNSPLSSAISETESISLAHDQSNISIKYAALNFINPENNVYAYKLEGLNHNDEWQILGKQRVVNFANLAPGKYMFKVKGANNDGVWSEKVKTLNITVRPPLWLTWWAYLIYFVLLSFAAAIVFRFLRNRAVLKRDLYLEHVHNEKLNELYNMKLNFFTNISHEIRTPLTLILAPLEKLMNENENINFSKSLHLVKSNADNASIKYVFLIIFFRNLRYNCAIRHLGLT